MADLHFKQFDGITVGVPSQSAAALLALKKSAYYGLITPRGWSRATKKLCVPSKRVAAALGDEAWLIHEHHLETVWWGDDRTTHYIVYDEEAK